MISEIKMQDKHKLLVCL